jgi:hypothetical protein
MINPPFPYQVRILRTVVDKDPFSEVESAKEEIYSGVCDFESTRFPTVKNGVQIGKYKLYIPDNTIPVMLEDTVELNLMGRLMEGKIVEFFPTNFGLTISWDEVNN